MTAACFLGISPPPSLELAVTLQACHDKHNIYPCLWIIDKPSTCMNFLTSQEQWSDLVPVSTRGRTTPCYNASLFIEISKTLEIINNACMIISLWILQKMKNFNMLNTFWLLKRLIYSIKIEIHKELHIHLRFHFVMEAKFEDL